MDREPLPKDIRLRVRIVVVCSAVLFLTMLLVVVVGLAGSTLTPGELVVPLLIGVGLPAVFLLLAYRMVRQARANPGRTRPNERANRVLLVGNVISVVIAIVVLNLVGHSWAGWVVGFAVILVCSFGVVTLARHEDPRINYFRRMEQTPDPGAEG